MSHYNGYRSSSFDPYTSSILGQNTRPFLGVSMVSRSPSPSPSVSLSRSRSSARSNSVIRRMCPQVPQYYRRDLDDERDDSPVVFDANLTFMLGCRGKLRQNVRPVPAHLESRTGSSALTNKIDDFLKRTDHVMDEWKRLGRKDTSYGSGCDRTRMGRSKSAANIMIKGFQLYSRASSCSRSSVVRDEETDCTEAEADEVQWVESEAETSKDAEGFQTCFDWMN